MSCLSVSCFKTYMIFFFASSVSGRSNDTLSPDSRIVCVLRRSFEYPPKDESQIRIRLRELKWCIVGLFGPELVLYAGWRQWASARQLRDDVHAILNPNGDNQEAQVEENDSRKVDEDAEQAVTNDQSASIPNSEWTMIHGFYATMGGFAIDLDDTPSAAVLFSPHKRLTLTAKGVLLLAKCGLLPLVSKKEIVDKSKADSLAKALVCVQAGWMIVQVISRSAARLPVTLLEVNTIGHVICALIMYILWWNKPRMVEHPTILGVDHVLPLMAYMFCASRISGSESQKGAFKCAVPEAELKQLAYFEVDSVNKKSRESPSRSQHPRHPLQKDSQHDLDMERHVPAPKANGTPKPISLPGRFDLRPNQQPLSPTFAEAQPADSSDAQRAERQRLAAQAVVSYAAIRSEFKSRTTSFKESGRTNWTEPFVDELLAKRVTNWPNEGLLRRTKSLIMGMTLWAVSLAYGAIHIAAWDYFFPSAVEAWIWHVSSVWVTICGAFWLMTNALAHVWPAIDELWIRFNKRETHWISDVIIITLCTICGSTYVFARAYLVIEAFISIRLLPKGAYDTPSWIQVFPHL